MTIGTVVMYRPWFHSGPEHCAVEIVSGSGRVWLLLDGAGSTSTGILELTAAGESWSTAMPVSTGCSLVVITLHGSLHKVWLWNRTAAALSD